jgi:two-component system, LytTR family, response regulator
MFMPLCRTLNCYNFDEKLNAMHISQIIHIGSRKRILSEDILYLQSDLNYTKVYTINGKMHLVSTTLKTIEARLSSSAHFLRINRGLVVNSNHIKSFNKKTLTIANKELNISRRRLSDMQNYGF